MSETSSGARTVFGVFEFLSGNHDDLARSVIARVEAFGDQEYADPGPSVELIGGSNTSRSEDIHHPSKSNEDWSDGSPPASLWPPPQGPLSVPVTYAGTVYYHWHDSVLHPGPAISTPNELLDDVTQGLAQLSVGSPDANLYATELYARTNVDMTVTKEKGPYVYLKKPIGFVYDRESYGFR